MEPYIQINRGSEVRTHLSCDNFSMSQIQSFTISYNKWRQTEPWLNGKRLIRKVNPTCKGDLL